MGQEITVRELRVSDRVHLTEILEKAAKELKDDSIKGLISSAKKYVTPKKGKESVSKDEVGKLVIIDIAFSFMSKARLVYDRDIIAWYADLIGATPEEFMSMPCSAETEVMTQIRAQPEAETFFTQLWELAKAMRVFDAPLKILRSQYGSIFAMIDGVSESSTTEK